MAWDQVFSGLHLGVFRLSVVLREQSSQMGWAGELRLKARSGPFPHKGLGHLVWLVTEESSLCDSHFLLPCW